MTTKENVNIFKYLLKCEYKISIFITTGTCNKLCPVPEIHSSHTSSAFLEQGRVPYKVILSFTKYGTI